MRDSTASCAGRSPSDASREFASTSTSPSCCSSAGSPRPAGCSPASRRRRWRPCCCSCSFSAASCSTSSGHALAARRYGIPTSRHHVAADRRRGAAGAHARPAAAGDRRRHRRAARQRGDCRCPVPDLARTPPLGHRHALRGDLLETLLLVNVGDDPVQPGPGVPDGRRARAARPAGDARCRTSAPRESLRSSARGSRSCSAWPGS